MQIIDTNQHDATEPPGHFGGLTLTEVIGPRDAEHITVQISRAPAGSGAEMHSHAESEQLFYILHGQLTVRTEDGESAVLAPGMGVYFAPLEGHATLNAGTAEVVAIVITSPHLS